MREQRPNGWAVLPAVALAANTVRAQDQTLYVSSAMANSAAARHTCVQNPEIAMYAPVCDLSQRGTILRIGSTTAAVAAGCPAVFNALFSGSHSLPYNTICDCIAATDRRRGGLLDLRCRPHASDLITVVQYAGQCGASLLVSQLRTSTFDPGCMFQCPMRHARTGCLHHQVVPSPKISSIRSKGMEHAANFWRQGRTVAL
jgi:hypothetical protein